ncbi:MAG: hypothetical protein WBN18_11405 [Flavobacteriaceae bacterium]
MEKDKKKEIEILLKNTIQEIGLETPSAKFKEELLAKVQLAGQHAIMPEKPLISKRYWGLLLVVVMGISGYLIFGNAKAETTWGLSFIGQVDSWANDFDFTSNIRLSDTLMYGLAGFALFLGIQILLLKHHFDKRYSY